MKGTLTEFIFYLQNEICLVHMTEGEITMADERDKEYPESLTRMFKCMYVNRDTRKHTRIHFLGR